MLLKHAVRYLLGIRGCTSNPWRAVMSKNPLLISNAKAQRLLQLEQNDAITELWQSQEA